MKLLSVIIVTYNSANQIDRCLQSLLKNLDLPIEILLVDNNSQDQTLTRVKRYDGRVKVFPQKENLGFARACNLAVKQAKGEHLLFLNPDTEVKHGLGDMVQYLDNHSEVGIIAPRLIDERGKPQPSVRMLPTLLRAIKAYWLGEKKSFDPYIPSGMQPQEVECVVGAALMIRKRLYLKLGGFAEKFFLYFEDLDLCRKVRQLGLKVVYFPAAEVVHIVGASAMTNPRAHKLLEQSAKIYYGLLVYWLLYVILWIGQRIRKISKYWSRRLKFILPLRIS